MFGVYFKFCAVALLKATVIAPIHVTHSAGFELIQGFHAAVRKIWSKISIVWRDQTHDVQKILITAYFQITETPWDSARKSVTAELSLQGFACEATHGLQ